MKRSFLNLSEFMETEVEYIPLLSSEDEKRMSAELIPEDLALLPLTNNVLFPGVVIPITAARNKSIQLIREAYANKQPIGVVTQIKSHLDRDPKEHDIYRMGTMATILKTLQMPDGSTMVIIQGKKRIRIERVVQEEPYLKAVVSAPPMTQDVLDTDPTFDAQISSIRDLVKRLMEISQQIPKDFEFALTNIESPKFLINFIASALDVDSSLKQKILESSDLRERSQYLIETLTMELQRIELKQQIQGKVRSEMDKQYREHVLQQQLKTIQEELGESPGDQDVEGLVDKASEKKWGKDMAQYFKKELGKLQRMNAMAPDYSIQFNYLTTLIDLPWNEYTTDNFKFKKIKETLDADHYGLEKIKARILEHIAVLKLKGDFKAPILCFYGPPGVGKTSLGRSIAHAMGRKYIRVSLGGLKDESEIRGHRKTYIGAMPGRIISSLKKAGSSNPVFVLDEIDKVLGMNYGGDPSAALLEVLDPEQNMAFHDNYLDVDYDLSKVMFVATANNLSTIPGPLLDRMEIIELSGYLLEEKVAIAQRHIIPKQIKEHGLTTDHIRFEVSHIRHIIEYFTRESGVRGLEKAVASVIRHHAYLLASNDAQQEPLSIEQIDAILGPYRHNPSARLKQATVGVVTGLAWTPVGGDVLFIEASLSPGKGQLSLTGNLGDVMKESATLAFEYLKSNANPHQIDPKIFDKYNIHIHVPEGAAPKDGPSAGIALLTAMYSVYLNKKVKNTVAMTGEITLRGQLLPVGGIREKILAAKRASIKTVVLCEENRRHIEEIPEKYLKGLHIEYITQMSDVFEIAF